MSNSTTTIDITGLDKINLLRALWYRSKKSSFFSGPDVFDEKIAKNKLLVDSLIISMEE